MSLLQRTRWSTSFYRLTNRKLCIVIVLDLSKPTEFWAHLTYFISSLESSINTALEKSWSQANRGSRKVEHNRICQLMNVNHPDRGLMAIFPVPLTIIGSKYDTFVVGFN